MTGQRDDSTALHTADIRSDPVLPEEILTPRTGTRARFWVSSIGWATALLIVGVFGTLFVTFLYGEIQAGDHSFDTFFESFFPAIFWTILGVIGTCYFSIPLAALAVALIRFIAPTSHRPLALKA